MPEVKGIALYQNALDNALLDNTSDVARKNAAAGSTHGADIQAALAFIMEHEHGCIDRKYQLDGNPPIRGGQAVVAMVKSVYQSHRLYALKMFADRSVYLREREVYAEYVKVCTVIAHTLVRFTQKSLISTKPSL